MPQWLEGEPPAVEGEASRKVLELKPRPRRKAGRNYQLLLKVKSETATRFAALAGAKACASANSSNTRWTSTTRRAGGGKTYERPGNDGNG
jgi:hypothetical protein